MATPRSTRRRRPMGRVGPHISAESLASQHRDGARRMQRSCRAAAVAAGIDVDRRQAFWAAPASIFDARARLSWRSPSASPRSHSTAAATCLNVSRAHRYAPRAGHVADAGILERGATSGDFCGFLGRRQLGRRASRTMAAHPARAMASTIRSGWDASQVSTDMSGARATTTPPRSDENWDIAGPGRRWRCSAFAGATAMGTLNAFASRRDDVALSRLMSHQLTNFNAEFEAPSRVLDQVDRTATRLTRRVNRVARTSKQGGRRRAWRRRSRRDFNRVVPAPAFATVRSCASFDLPQEPTLVDVRRARRRTARVARRRLPPTAPTAHGLEELIWDCAAFE